MRWEGVRVLAVAAGAIVGGCQLAVETTGLSSGGTGIDAGANIDAGESSGGTCLTISVDPSSGGGPVTPLDSRWIVQGSATIDGPALRLTNDQQQFGAIWWDERVTFGDFHVTATFRMQAPDAQNIADGFTFVWVRGAVPAPGEPGGGLGVEGLDGWAVAIDLFANHDHPFMAAAPYVAVLDTKKSVAERTLVARTVPFPITDGEDHVLAVTMQSGEVSVSVDQSRLIERFVVPGYAPFTGHFGFTATTGAGVTIQRLVRAAMTAGDCP